MTTTERIELSRSILKELLETSELNPVHQEYAQSLIQRINNELIPQADSVTETASRILLEEILKVSSIIIFSKSKKIPSCRVTKKSAAKFFRDGKSLFEAYTEMKSSRYGLAMMSMNINQFMKIIDK